MDHRKIAGEPNAKQIPLFFISSLSPVRQQTFHPSKGTTHLSRSGYIYFHLLFFNLPDSDSASPTSPNLSTRTSTRTRPRPRSRLATPRNTSLSHFPQPPLPPPNDTTQRELIRGQPTFAKQARLPAGPPRSVPVPVSSPDHRNSNEAAVATRDAPTPPSPPPSPQIRP